MTNPWVVAALVLVAGGGQAKEPTGRSGPAARLIFAVETTQLAEVVARAQARLDAFGVRAATVSQRGKQLIVELPEDALPLRSEIKQLLSRPLELRFTLVDNGSAFMDALADYANTDLRAHTLGIVPDHESWQSADTTRAVEYDTFLLGQRDALERYLAGLDEKHRLARDHGFLLEPVPKRPKLWRTWYVDLTQQIRIRRVEEATVKHNDFGGEKSVDLSLRLLTADGERIRALTSSHIGKKMAISADEEIISIPLIEGAVGGKGLMVIPSEEQARRLAASLRGGPLLAPVTFLKEKALRPAR